MTQLTLTLNQARLVNLHAQGLLHPPASPATKTDVMSAIRRMGILQIDTINVVARSPYLVFYSRLGDYNPAWLDELLAEQALFEYWAHAACFIPSEEYLLYRRFMLEGAHSYFEPEWIEENRDALNQVLEAVQQKGPLRSADFKSVKETGGWWNRKLEKWALEYWFLRGELGIAHRENFQRVYDLTERLMPGLDDSNLPDLENIYLNQILKTVRALGICLQGWAADYYRIKKKLTVVLLHKLIDCGELLQVKVEDFSEPVLYLPEQESLLTAATRGDLVADYTTLFSPFDPLTWDRHRARQLYNFDFMIQSYTPALKRTFGYFPLPVLHNGQLIGRLDAKAHRKEGNFEVRGLFLEQGVGFSSKLAQDLASALSNIARWHGTPRVVLAETLPIDLITRLRNFLDDDH